MKVAETVTIKCDIGDAYDTQDIIIKQGSVIKEVANVIIIEREG